jgi:protein SCO1/2
MNRRPRLFLTIAAGLLVLAALLFAILSSSRGTGAGSSSAVASGPTAEFEGAPIPGTVPAPAFTLTDQGGRLLSLSSLRGREVVIAFPYTTCRNSCVVLVQQIRGSLDELAKAPAVLLVSANPAADTPARIQSFLGRVSLTGRASYLTGTPAELRRVWQQYHVTPAAAGAPAYAKYATVLLLDGRGDERVLYGQEQLTPEALTHDIRKLQGG